MSQSPLLGSVLEMTGLDIYNSYHLMYSYLKSATFKTLFLHVVFNPYIFPWSRLSSSDGNCPRP